jgi:cytochrome c-type biogenesis protein
VLAALLTYAGATGSLARGAGLLFLYALGLGIPFIATALLYRRAEGSFGWLRQHGLAITRAGGAVLVVMGILLLTGGWTAVFAPVLRWYAKFGWPPI